MAEREDIVSCPWCGGAIHVSSPLLSRVGTKDAWLRCGCGAVGLPTIEPEADRWRLAEELLGISRRLWADEASGLDRVEWRIIEAWSRLRKLEALVVGREVWVALLWGRRR
jgi:hypothetical protein